MFNIFAVLFRKNSGKITRTVTTSETTTEEIDVRRFAGGSITVSSGITTLTLYAGHETGDTFLPYYDKENVAVTLTVASTRIVQLPATIYDLAFVKLVANTSGTINLTLKS
jgi:hypothetical protein